MRAHANDKTTMTLGRQRLIAALLLSLTVATGWFAYAPSLGASFLLDDLSNLDGLRLVEDQISALYFIFSGEAGPLGRPLALASFVPQAAAWGQDAAPFLRINILIHLANGCFLALVLYELSVLRGIRETDALFVAVAAAAIWLFMPLLASSSLMIVQRMTTLSASFVLLALAGYLHARRSIEHNPSAGLIGMSISLVAGTMLAALTKESGALLPVFALVVELTILKRPVSIKPALWRAWASVFLLLPAVLILAYVVTRVPYSAELILRRDFTGWERFLTEARILWEYLFSAFIPRPGNFSPFHDGYPIARTIIDPITSLALLGWLITLTAAVLLRRRFPIFSFAALWFFGGHLLESTLIPLELYFEHRNYMPIIGPVYALVTLAAQAPAPRKRLVYSAVSAYILLNLFVLAGQTTLWGSSPMAARYWQERFPDSVRAATLVVTHQLAQDGPGRALKTLHQLVEDRPEAGYLKIQELNLYCIIHPSEDHHSVVSDLDSLLNGVDFSYSAGTMLSQLFTTVTHVECNGVDNDTVRMLATSLLGNPRYKADPGYNQLHHQLMARISRYEGEFDQTIQHLQFAMEYKPSADLNMMFVTTYADAKDFDSARGFIELARRNHPINPMKHFVWSKRLDTLSLFIDDLDRESESARGSR